MTTTGSIKTRRRPFGSGQPVSLFTLGTMRALQSPGQLGAVVEAPNRLPHIALSGPIGRRGFEVVDPSSDRRLHHRLELAGRLQGPHGAQGEEGHRLA